MARTYDIPPDTSEKEKAIGGLLTFAQFGWLIGGFVIGLLIFLGIYMLIKNTVIGVICALPFALIGLPFAFSKKYEMPLLTYLNVKRKFKSKTHKLINTR